MDNRLNTDALETSMSGAVLTPDSPEFDAARKLWNGMIDRRPAVIARCTSAEDVIAAVNFARENALSPTIRGGGHGVAGLAVNDGGLMIDLSLLNTVAVDKDARTARVGPGVTLGEMDAATQAHGLATTGGVDSRTGVAGLTLGGGNGWLARSFGLSLDNLISLEVVTADGQLRHVSEREHPDLFWALRGGGGRLAVVTSFEFRLHRVGPELATAQIFHSLSDGADALRFYRDFMMKAPDQLGCAAMMMRIPPIEPFPEAQHGKVVIAFVGCWSGAVDEGMAVLEKLQSHGNPVFAAVQPMRYADFQQNFNAATPDGARYYWKSQFLETLSDAAIEALIPRIESLPGEFSLLAFECMGAAVGRVDAAATAYPHRAAPFNFGIWTGWADPADDEHHIAWTRELHETMKPYGTGGVYVNYQDQDETGKTHAAFGTNAGRLKQVKAKYDPGNLFMSG